MLTSIFLDLASETLLFIIASAIALPVFMAISTVLRSVSRLFRYSFIPSISPFEASTFMVCIWLR